MGKGIEDGKRQVYLYQADNAECMKVGCVLCSNDLMVLGWDLTIVNMEGLCWVRKL
jgi:hypothetical protein